MTTTSPSVVAGVSRLRPAMNEQVIGWAADEASARRLPLELVHAQEWPRGTSPSPEPGHPARTWSTHLRASGRTLLEDARWEALTRHPGLPVTTDLVDDRPAHALLEAGRTAALVVLGAHRHSWLEGVFAGGGRKGHALIGHLPCPLALVPEPSATALPDAPVVVGVDGSDGSLAALELAFAEADAAGAELVAVEVLRPHDAAKPRLSGGPRWELSEILAGRRERYLDTPVRCKLLTGDAAPMLASAARGARCLVVGSHGRGGFREMLLGSTGRALVNHTPCPLLIAPAPSLPEAA